MSSLILLNSSVNAQNFKVNTAVRLNYAIGPWYAAPTQSPVRRYIYIYDDTFTKIISASAACSNLVAYESWGPSLNHHIGTLENINKSNLYYYSTHWLDVNSSNNCVYNSGSDLGYGFLNQTLPIDSYQPNQWNTIVTNGTSTYGSQDHISLLYHYRNGRRTTPLDFGVISPNTTYANTNSNRAAPAGSDATKFGYSNDWSSGSHQTGRDVTYTFQLNVPQIVDIDITKTGSILTYLYKDGILSQITSGSINNSYLCAGSYKVVMDGEDSDFTISVSGTARNPSAGSISFSNSGGLNIREVCPNAIVGPIYSLTPPTSVCSGTISYQWQRRLNGGSWSNIAGYSANLDANTAGNIGGNSSIAFRRIAYEANGGSAISNSIICAPYTPAATFSGNIAGGGSIPLNQEIATSLNSTESGVANPQTVYSWQQSINEGASWQAVSPGQGTAGFVIPNVNTMGFTSNQINSLSDLQIQYKRRTESSCNNTVFIETTPEIIDIVKSNGTIKGTVLTKTGTAPGPNGITVYAHRFTNVQGGLADKLDSVITTNGGQYEFTKLYYGRTGSSFNDQASYHITPFKELHGFSPDSQLVVLSTSSFVKENINFNDTTGFVIQGYVTQECPSCDGNNLAENTDSLKAVSIKINGQSFGDSTGVTGKYAVIRENSGNYIIKPEFSNHQFGPSQQTVNVGTNNIIVSGINFKDISTQVISGFIALDTTAGTCSPQGLGIVEITFSKILDPGKGITRIKKTISTNSQGFYSVSLPAGKYRAEIQSITSVPTGQSLNAATMISFLNAYPDSLRVRDVTERDTTMTLIYYEAPQIRVFGLNPPECQDPVVTVPPINVNQWDDYTIFKQGVPKEFEVRVFRGNPENGCLVISDTLRMSTNIQVSEGAEKLDTLLQNGKVTLSLIGGEPNTTPPDYVKTLSFDFTDQWGRVATSLILKPIVTGIRTSTGSFLTVSPQVPFLILRDPPGDLSNSFMETGTTTETARSFQYGDAKEIGTWVEAKAGAKFEAGIGFSTESEFYGTLSGSMNAKKRNTVDNEQITTITTTSKFSTDDGSSGGIVGEEGDVFVGAAINLKYSKVFEVLYDKDSCKFKVKNSFMTADSGFATTFVYTENHIKNTLLPILRNARDLETVQAKKDSTSNQIKVWEQTLLRNQELKRSAIFVKNYSFDGAAGPIEKSNDSTATSSITIEFEMEIETDIALELGMEVGGSGVKGGSNIKMRMQTGAAENNTNIQSSSIGYVLDDKDSGDYFSVNVKTCQVYGTPVFELAAGTSSCPNEKGTMPRDRMEFQVPDPEETVAANEKATFQLKLSNTSESGEARNYYVRYIQGSADGTIIDLDGNSSALPLSFINMPYNQPANTIFAGVLKQPSSTVFSYGDIRFQVYDDCNNGNPAGADIVKEVSVTANFVNPCSPIALSLPADNFTLSSNEIVNNEITVEFTDYVYSQSFDDVTFQYALVGSNIWYTPTNATFTKAQLDNSLLGSQRQINIAALPDGAYKFRARLKCGVNTIYSKTNHGIIDRKGPLLFGAFEPADKNYVQGDVISATFNENLKCSDFEPSDFTLKKKSNNEIVAAVLGCYQNQVIITPNSPISSLTGEEFLVTLSGVTDASGNDNPNTFSWSFGVGTSPVSSSPYLVSISSDMNQIAENSSGAVAVTFTLSQKKIYDNVIYYNLGGNGVLNEDYNSQNQNLTTGYQGSVTIDSNEVSKTIYITLIDDNKVESDEFISFELVPSAEYKFTSNSSKTITIIDNDILGDNCENGGLPYDLTNNNGGSSAIIPSTYHNLILNSDGRIETPTTVVFKGEKSITLNPGFIVESGSVFTAILEDCPQAFSSSSSTAVFVNKKPTLKGIFADDPVKIFTEYEVEEMDKNGDIVLQFYGMTEFGLTAVLMDRYTNPIYKETTMTVANTDKESITIHTAHLSEGTYHLKIKREGRTIFHHFVIKK